MSHFVARLLGKRPSRASIALAAALFFAIAAIAAHAQFGPSTGQIVPSPILRPPAGSRVAIVEFGDLQCPACAAANPVLKEAAAKYRIPWERRDFLIPMHNWSRNAAIYARWFDKKNKSLGDDYRDQVFANQSSIFNPGMLTAFTQRFAQSHGIALPFAIDPQGTLTAEVESDVDLGKRLGIQQTPTVFIVMNGPHGPAYIKVTNVEQDLYNAIDRALAATR